MKKKEYLTIRCDKETKEALEKIANEKEWTISHTAEKILRDFIQQNKN